MSFIRAEVKSKAAHKHRYLLRQEQAVRFQCDIVFALVLYVNNTLDNDNFVLNIRMHYFLIRFVRKCIILHFRPFKSNQALASSAASAMNLSITCGSKSE